MATITQELTDHFLNLLKDEYIEDLNTKLRFLIKSPEKAINCRATVTKEKKANAQAAARPSHIIVKTLTLDLTHYKYTIVFVEGESEVGVYYKSNLLGASEEPLLIFDEQRDIFEDTRVTARLKNIGKIERFIMDINQII